MLELFYPSQLTKDVFSINYEKLFGMGFRGIIFDIDNTLVHHGDNSNAQVDELFCKIKNIGLKTLLLTNNDEERVLRFIKNIDTQYICEAEKPKPQGYYKAIEKLGIKKEEALVVGDQIFVDILGANKCGIKNILVDFIRLEGETKFGKKRQLEKLILKLYKRNKKFYNRLGM